MVATRHIALSVPLLPGEGEAVICRLSVSIELVLPATMAADPPAEQPKNSRSWKRRQAKKRQQARAAAVDAIEEPTAVGMALVKAFAENGVAENGAVV